MRKGSHATEETRRKMREAQLRRWSNRREIYLQTCCLEPHVGRKRSRATRKRMSLAQKRFLAANPGIRLHRQEAREILAAAVQEVSANINQLVKP